MNDMSFIETSRVLVDSEPSMSAENETGRDVQTRPDSDVDLFDENGEQHHALSAQAQRDEEIAAMEQHSRHQPPTIQRPPEMPPAPPRTALMIVGVLCWCCWSPARSL